MPWATLVPISGAHIDLAATVALTLAGRFPLGRRRGRGKEGAGLPVEADFARRCVELATLLARPGRTP